MLTNCNYADQLQVLPLENILKEQARCDPPMILELPADVAKERYGDRLLIAPLGAVEKGSRRPGRYWSRQKILSIASLRQVFALAQGSIFFSTQ